MGSYPGYVSVELDRDWVRPNAREAPGHEFFTACQYAVVDPC